MHLTLAFLGEISEKRVPDIIQSMKDAANGNTSYVMRLEGLGKFVNHKESLYWCGVRKNAILSRLQYSLVANLKERGIHVDDKPFKPHITLGRRCIMQASFDERAFSQSISPIELKVDTIHLMRSDQIHGKVVYTSLGEVELKY